jgi:hypothetical protein
MTTDNRNHLLPVRNKALRIVNRDDKKQKWSAILPTIFILYELITD